jgi:hypothetical protein
MRVLKIALALPITVWLLAACSEEVQNLPTTTATGATTTGTVVAISGQPATSATTGVNYTFTPKTTAAGAAVTFAISNAPAWATFDRKAGTLSVTDGTSSASLATFAIQVAAQAVSSHLAGTATLAWDAPTSNVDGTPLASLAGYRINYGTNVAVLDHSIVINDGGATTYNVQALAPGTWYFAIQAVAASGTESIQSEVASATISL